MSELDFSGFGQFANSFNGKKTQGNGRPQGSNKSGGNRPQGGNKLGGGRPQGGNSYGGNNHSQGGKSYGGNRPQSGTRSYGGGRPQGEEPKYAGAPYNFIPFYPKVVPVEDKTMLVRGCVKDELLSGEVAYSIKAETPIFVDDGTDQHEFYKNIYEEYAIPGSSVRGLIRGHAQILGFSGFENDIDDYTLLYRKVGANVEDPDKKRYDGLLGAGQVMIQQGQKSRQVSVLKNVKAGYIRFEDGKYRIYQTKVKQILPKLEQMNYYVLSERHICAHLDEDGFRFFKEYPEILQYDLSKGFREKGFGKRKNYEGTLNRDYEPGCYNVSYEIKNEKDVCAVGKPGVYSRKGTLVGTGKMNGKKALYIVPEMDQKEFIEIPEKDEKAFQIDFEKKKNTLRTFGGADKFALPGKEKAENKKKRKSDEIRSKDKVIFYINLDGRLYFGYTPRLRLFYDHSIKDGYKQTGTENFDYAKSIFGCTGDNGSFRSKVSFSDAVVEKENPDKDVTRQLILGEPKPSSYMDYLDQTKGFVTYNHDFVLRGVKQYWLRPTVIEGGAVSNVNVGSVVKGLSAGNVFHGKIRFQNLTKAELGLLLWCLRLEKDSQVNIGKAKAYGYGRCSISNLSVQVINPEKAYLGESLDLNPFEAADVDECIAFYKKEMSEKLQKNIDDVYSVKTFFLMKDAAIMPDAEKIRYMEIGKKEYQSRKVALQKPEELVKKK